MADTNKKTVYSAHGMPGDCLDDGWLATLQIHMPGQLGSGHSSDPWEKSPVEPLLEFTYSSDLNTSDQYDKWTRMPDCIDNDGRPPFSSSRAMSTTLQMTLPYMVATLQINMALAN